MVGYTPRLVLYDKAQSKSSQPSTKETNGYCAFLIPAHFLYRGPGGASWPGPVLEGHSTTVTCLAFTTDGSHLVSGAQNAIPVASRRHIGLISIRVSGFCAPVLGSSASLYTVCHGMCLYWTQDSYETRIANQRRTSILVLNYFIITGRRACYASWYAW